MRYETSIRSASQFFAAFGIVAASISSNDEIPAYFYWCLGLVAGALAWNVLNLVIMDWRSRDYSHLVKSTV